MYLFEGALENAPAEALDAYGRGSKYKVKAYHDLEMVVRCIFQSISPLHYACMSGKSQLLRGKPKLRSDSINNFWSTELCREPYAKMVKAAQALQYDVLIEIVTNLHIPGV